MAVVQDPNLPDQSSGQQGSNSNQQNNQSQQQTGNFSQPISVSGNASTSSGPGGYKGSGTSSPSGTNAPSSSGTYQNLQNYLNANQGYINQGGLASQLSNSYNNQAQGLQNNINNSASDWYSQNSSKDVDPNQASQVVSGALANPTQYAADPNNVSQFQNYLTASTNYVAPTSFDPSQTYQGQVQNYDSQVGQLGTSAGRQTALQQLYSNPYYSQGQQSLDNLILGAGVDVNGVNQLQTLQNNAQQYGQNLQSAYNTANTDIGNSINQYAVDAAQTQGATQGALGGAITNFDTANQATVAQDLTNRQNDYQVLSNALGAGNITSDQANALGISGQTPLYGVNAGNFLTQNTYTPTVQNVITPDQYAQIQALSTLAGTDLTTQAGAGATSAMANYNNDQNVGAYANQPLYSFNNAGFQNATQTAQSDLANQIATIKNPITSFDAGVNSSSIPQLIQQIQADIPSRQQADLNLINTNGVVGNGGGITGMPAGYHDAQNLAYQQQIIQEQNAIQSLQNLFQQYGLNPTTGLSNSYLNIGPAQNSSNAGIPENGNNSFPLVSK